MKIILIILVILAIAYVLINRRKRDFRMERSLVIKATPQKLAEILGNFDHDLEWNSFMKGDPIAVYSREGATTGKGSILHWNGKKSGAGTTEILEANDKIVKRSLNMKRPIKANNMIAFDFEPVTGGTKVTWSMSGCNGFLGKAMGLFMNMEKMLDKPFTQGLEDLANFAEK